MDYKSQIDLNKLPKHIAIIMDGNGRWAKKQGHNRVFGHRNGVKAVQDTVEACAEIGVEYLTLYAFSTENWDRPKLEVNALMQLLVSTIKAETKTLNKNNIKLEAIGNLDLLPGKCKNELLTAIDQTKDNTRMTLILALSYSSKSEIISAIKKIGNKIASGDLDPDQIDETMLDQNLMTKNFPDPELLIRTSGETRISNFLLWQIAYAELYFTEVLWPDFRKGDLYRAIFDFQNRERRFGKISEQIALK